MKAFRFVFLFAMVFYGSNGYGQESIDLSLYGIKLGEPLNLKECPHSNSPEALKRSSPTLYKYQQLKKNTEPCFKLNSADLKMLKSPPDMVTLAIAWPFLEGPSIAQTDSVAVLQVDGVVQRIWMATYGLSAQENNLEALRKKFGKESALNIVEMGNRVGAKFPVVTAIWSFQQGNLTFLGATHQTNIGEIVLETPKGAEIYKKRLEEIMQRGPKM